MVKYLTLLLAGFGLCALLTPMVRSLAGRFGAVDQPGERKIHSQPMPRLGGVSIFISFHLILLVSSQLEFFRFPENFFREGHYGWILLATIIVLGVGVVDDFRTLRPAPKLFFQIMAALMIAITSYRIEVISLPFGTFELGIWAVPATVFWIVALINAVNLLDGLDGLAAGTSFIVCITMFGISLLQQNVGIGLVSIIFAGSILGFLKYNFHPASIFLGDSGAYLLGFKLALLSLQSGLKGTTTITILVPIIALGLPLMDTALAMLRRLLKSLHIMEVDPKKNEIKFFFLDGWSIFRADKDHIHHRLLRLGFTQKKAVILLYSISLVLGGLALSSVYLKNINNAFLIFTIGFASYIGIKKLGYSEIQVLSNGSLLPLFDSPIVSQKLLRVFVDIGIISISYYLAFLLRFEGRSPDAMKEYYLSTVPMVLLIKTIVFYVLGLYRKSWRYTSIGDLIRIFNAVAAGCIVAGVILLIVPGFHVFSFAALIIDFNLLLLLIFGARCSFRILDHLHTSANRLGKNVLIYGVDKAGVYALKEFIENPRFGLRPVGFIDDDPKNHGKEINGYPVLGSLEKLEKLLKGDSISEIILPNGLSPGKLERLSQICSSHQIPIRRLQTQLEEVRNGV